MLELAGRLGVCKGVTVRDVVHEERNAGLPTLIYLKVMVG